MKLREKVKFLEDQLNEVMESLELATAIIKRQHEILTRHNIDPTEGTIKLPTEKRIIT